MRNTNGSAPSIWLVAIGLVTLLGQVVLLREMQVAFYGSELIYLLAMGVLLLGTAAGSWAGRLFRAPSGAQVRSLLLAYACCLPALIALARGLRLLFRAVPGAFLPFSHQVLGMALGLLPCGILAGLLFQRAALLYMGRARSLAAAYALESLGGLLGGGLATLLLAWGVQNLAAGLLGASLAALASAPGRRRPTDALGAASVALLLLLALSLAMSPSLDARLTRWNHPHLAGSSDTPYGRVTFDRSGEQVSVFQNDALAFENQGTSAEEFVHMAALQVADPRRVLVLGGFVEGLVPEVLKHRPGRVADAEIDGTFLDLALRHLPEREMDTLRAPGATVFLGDPRRILSEGSEYDLILSAMPEPDSGQANRFYTREFFRECRRHLSPAGVLAFRLRASENFWTPALSKRASSIHRALRAEFRDVLVLPGTTILVLASGGALSRDPEALSERLRERSIGARLVCPPYIRYLLTNDRLGEIEARLRSTPAPENTDGRPICYSYTLLLWLSRFFPAVGRWDGGAAGSGSPWAWVIVALAFGAALIAAFRRWPEARWTLLVFAAGFAGMVLEGCLILGYQVRQGVLYRDLGLLLTFFMGGLALGAMAASRLASRRPPKGPPTQVHGAAFTAGLAALCLMVFALFRWGSGAGLAGTCGLLLLGGAFTGALFAYASLRAFPGESGAVSRLYASDLLGGCAGSLLGCLFLIPVLGLPATTAILAALALSCLALI